MEHDLFIDTSGFYSILVGKDDKHSDADRILDSARSEKRFLRTTDYVLSETATLLKARGHSRLCEPLFEHVFESLACNVEWTTPERFGRLRAFFRKHVDQDWSYTDCLSFCVMREHGIQLALTKDRHFEQAGFVALLK